MRKIVVLGIIAIVVVVWNVTVWYVDDQLAKRDHSTVYNDCHTIWSSRGLYNSHDERNSITSFKRAFEHGALGAEVDFHYDVKMNRFMISHGHPKKDAEGNFIYPKKDGKLLDLEHLFQAVGQGHYFWLDYKNLEKLSDSATEQAIDRLLAITQNDAIRERLYIEASNPLALERYTKAGFKTILGIHPLPEKNLFSTIVVNGYKIAYGFSDITALAMPYGKREAPVYGPETQKSLASTPVFLFHVPVDDALLTELSAKSSVRVILAGRDKSIDRFFINDCKAPQTDSLR